MSQSEEAWSDVGRQFKKLGSMFKHHYETQGGGEDAEAVSEGEVRDAVRSLGESIRTAFATVSDAIKDSEVQEEARQTAGSLFDALGATLSELGDDISKWRERGESSDPPSSTEAAPPDASEEEE